MLHLRIGPAEGASGFVTEIYVVDNHGVAATVRHGRMCDTSGEARDYATRLLRRNLWAVGASILYRLARGGEPTETTVDWLPVRT